MRWFKRFFCANADSLIGNLNWQQQTIRAQKQFPRGNKAVYQFSSTTLFCIIKCDPVLCNEEYHNDSHPHPYLTVAAGVPTLSSSLAMTRVMG